MSLSMAEIYLLKAQSSYPYDLEEVLESLGYAYSHDDEHAGVHCLYGQIYAEQLKNIEGSIHHFELALLYDKHYVETYQHYIELLISVEHFDQASELIERGIHIKGVNKAMLVHYRAQIMEKRGDLEGAKLTLNESLDFSACVNSVAFLKLEIARINDKLKRINDAKIESANYLDEEVVDYA